MSRLGEALTERNEARARYEEAKHELLEAVVDAVEHHEGGLFAHEIANEAEVCTRGVMGVIQSAVRRQLLEGRRERVVAEYVRLNADGSINMNDRVVRVYEANKYTPSRHYEEQYRR